MRRRILWIQLQRLLEIALRAEPVPIVSKPDKRSRRVSFSQFRIGVDGFLCRRLRFRHLVDRPDYADVAKQCV
jgi:hypothetical protein